MSFGEDADDRWKLDYEAIAGWVCGPHYEMLVSGATFRYASIQR